MSVVGGAKIVHCKESTCATGIQRRKGFADHFKETSILISKHSRKHLKLCQMTHACHHRTQEDETRKQLQVQGLSRLHGQNHDSQNYHSVSTSEKGNKRKGRWEKRVSHSESLILITKNVTLAFMGQRLNIRACVYRYPSTEDPSG